MDFQGEFETHLTIALRHGQEVNELQHWAERRGLKCLHIVLARGETPSQPMLTRRGQGRFRQELEKARELSEALNAAGFDIVRIKLEIPAESEHLPELRTDAPEQAAVRYFEHHIKLLLSEDDDLFPLSDLAVRHSAHLSRNSLRVRDDGFREHFITQRSGRRRTEAHDQLLSLLAELTKPKRTILSVEEEYVVFDSNLDVDRGWIEE